MISESTTNILRRITPIIRRLLISDLDLVLRLAMDSFRLDSAEKSILLENLNGLALAKTLLNDNGIKVSSLSLVETLPIDIDTFVAEYSSTKVDGPAKQDRHAVPQPLPLKPVRVVNHSLPQIRGIHLVIIRCVAEHVNCTYPMVYNAINVSLNLDPIAEAKKSDGQWRHPAQARMPELCTPKRFGVVLMERVNLKGKKTTLHLTEIGRQVYEANVPPKSNANGKRRLPLPSPTNAEF